MTTTAYVDRRFGVQALRYDVGAEQVVVYLLLCLAAEQLPFLIATEFQQDGVLKRLRAQLAKRLASGRLKKELAAHGYAVRRTHEYLFIWSRDAARANPHSKVRRRRFSRVPGIPDWRNLFAGFLGLFDRGTGMGILLAVAHAPAGIEMGTRFRKGTQLLQRASREGCTALGRRLQHAHQVHPDWLVLLGIDLNLNQFEPEWREYADDTLGGESIWTAKRLPSIGDHGSGKGRLIVTIRYWAPTNRRVDVVRAYVSRIRRPKGMDHRLVVGVFRIYLHTTTHQESR